MKVGAKHVIGCLKHYQILLLAGKYRYFQTPFRQVKQKTYEPQTQNAVFINGKYGGGISIRAAPAHFGLQNI